MRSLVQDWFRLARSAEARPFLLIALCADGAFLFVFLVAIQSYLPEQHGGGVGLAGYALAAYGAAKLVAQLFAGRVVDRFGSSRAAQIGLGIIALGQAGLIGAVVQPAAVLPAAAVYGFGSAVLWPALYARASQRFPQEERAKLAAAITVTTGIALALGLGLGLALPAAFPYAAATVIALGVVLLAAVAATNLAGPDLRDTEEEQSVSLRAVIATALDRRRLVFALFVLLESVAIGSLQAIFRSYGRDLLGVSFRHELLLLAPALLTGAGAVVVGGVLADRFGRLPLLSVGFLTTGVAVWLLAGVVQPAALIPLAVLGGVGAGLAMPSMSALSMDLSRTAGQGTVLAWFMMMEGLGHAGGAALGGWVNSSADPAGVLRVAAVLFFSIGLVSSVGLVSGNVSTAQGPDASTGGLPASPPKLGARRRMRLWTASGALVFGLGVPSLALYWAMAPSSQVYGTIITHGPRDDKVVALTFDDGPNDPWTLRIADVLDGYGVKGTFFVVGRNAAAHPEIVRSLVERGHLVGNHSYHHRKRDAIFDVTYGELTDAERSIASAGGVCPAFFRSPNGFHTPWQLHAVSTHRMQAIGWDVNPNDWKRHDSAALERSVVRSVRPGSIILLHDGEDTRDVTDRSVTVAALPGIIRDLQSNGYRFVRLDELLHLPPYLPTCAVVARVGHARQHS